MAKISGLGFGAIFTSDFAKTLEFYEALRFVTDWKEDKGTAMLRAGSFELFLHAKKKSKSSGKKKEEPLLHLHLEVDDVDSFHSEIKQRGLKLRVLPKTRPWGHRSFHVKDPNGIEWEIYSEVNKS